MSNGAGDTFAATNGGGVGGPAPGPLVVVGGYGLVGGQAARLLRKRNPDLRLVLAGRNPRSARRIARELGAAAAAVDANAARPLDALAERPAAVLAAVSDPDDRLLLDAMRRGIPFADINRGGHADVLDVAVHAAHERPAAPVLLSGSWISGMTALTAAAVVREVGQAERVDITVLVSSSDRVGRDSWGFSKRWAWPFHVTEGGHRRPVHPLTDVRRVPCADGRPRPAARVGTLEQITLPVTLGVPTVETRMAVNESPALWGLVALKRSGALRLLDRPGLHGVREALLHRSGEGDLAGFTVTAQGRGRAAAVDVLDLRGQSYLNAVGAANAAELVLGIGVGPLPPGISFPEQHARPRANLAMLTQAGAIVSRRGFDDGGDPARARAGDEAVHPLDLSPEIHRLEARSDVP